MEGEHYFCSPSIVETLYIKETKTEEFDDNKTNYTNNKYTLQ